MTSCHPEFASVLLWLDCIQTAEVHSQGNLQNCFHSSHSNMSKKHLFCAFQLLIQLVTAGSDDKKHMKEENQERLWDEELSLGGEGSEVTNKWPNIFR